jgi:hypothetical protein
MISTFCDASVQATLFCVWWVTEKNCLNNFDINLFVLSFHNTSKTLQTYKITDPEIWEAKHFEK